jgi:diacylglycerol kinase (ATP)
MMESEGYIRYIINPNSGASSNKRLVSGLKDYFDQKKIDARTSFTTSLSHACRLASEAAVDYNCRLVVAAGGDGTIREVAQGLEGSDKPLLIVPSGTENLLANELGFNLKVDSLIKAYEGDCIKPLDLGCFNDKCFTSIAGFGFDGDVVRRIHKIRTGHICHRDYFWPIWRTFWEYTFPTMRVRVDGETLFEGRGLVFVGNITHYAIGLEICKRGSFSDGLLDICVMKCANQAHLLKHAAWTVAKAHLRGKDTIYRQGKEVIVEPLDEPIYTEIDGDPGPALPAKISIIPQALKVLTPPGAKPAGIRTRLMRMIG